MHPPTRRRSRPPRQHQQPEIPPIEPISAEPLAHPSRNPCSLPRGKHLERPYHTASRHLPQQEYIPTNAPTAPAPDRPPDLCIPFPPRASQHFSTAAAPPCKHVSTPLRGSPPPASPSCA